MNTRQLANALTQQNINASKSNAQRRAGAVINERLIKLVKPRLPMMMRGYADEPLFAFILANAFSATIIKIQGENPKATWIAEGAINAANDELIGSFNIEGMLGELLDGINLPTDYQEPKTMRNYEDAREASEEGA